MRRGGDGGIKYNSLQRLCDFFLRKWLITRLLISLLSSAGVYDVVSYSKKKLFSSEFNRRVWEEDDPVQRSVYSRETDTDTTVTKYSGWSEEILWAYGDYRKCVPWKRLNITLSHN